MRKYWQRFGECLRLQPAYKIESYKAQSFGYCFTLRQCVGYCTLYHRNGLLDNSGIATTHTCTLYVKYTLYTLYMLHVHVQCTCHCTYMYTVYVTYTLYTLYMYMYSVMYTCTCTVLCIHVRVTCTLHVCLGDCVIKHFLL